MYPKIHHKMEAPSPGRNGEQSKNNRNHGHGSSNGKPKQAPALITHGFPSLRVLQNGQVVITETTTTRTVFDSRDAMRALSAYHSRLVEQMLEAGQ